MNDRSSTPAHTPGPWTALSPAPWDGDDGKWIIPGVALCGNGEFSEANALLIAAAPDMYSVMLRYLPLIERLEADPALWDRFAAGTGIATANGYRAAIAKATGAA